MGNKTEQIRELKTCPFCGGKANHFGGGGQHCIKCIDCGITNEKLMFDTAESIWIYFAYDTIQEAIDAWNRREATK